MLFPSLVVRFIFNSGSNLPPIVSNSLPHIAKSNYTVKKSKSEMETQHYFLIKLKLCPVIDEDMQSLSLLVDTSAANLSVKQEGKLISDTILNCI